MNHHRRFWDEVLVALEESLAAFSGVDPELIAAAAMIPKTCRRDGGRRGSSAQASSCRTRRRGLETRLKETNRR